jgi:cytochrome P450
MGAPLARVEAQEAFAALARRLPNLDGDLQRVVRKPNVTLRGLESFPVCW